MKRVMAKALLDEYDKANLAMIEESLSDNSKVYNVMVGSFEYPADDINDAMRIYSLVLKAIERG